MNDLNDFDLAQICSALSSETKTAIYRHLLKNKEMSLADLTKALKNDGYDITYQGVQSAVKHMATYGLVSLVKKKNIWHVKLKKKVNIEVYDLK